MSIWRPITKTTVTVIEVIARFVYISAAIMFVLWYLGVV